MGRGSFLELCINTVLVVGTWSRHLFLRTVTLLTAIETLILHVKGCDEDALGHRLAQLAPGSSGYVLEIICIGYRTGLLCDLIKR